MAQARYRYFEPQRAASLGKLRLVARAMVEGFITGLHRSPHHGFSVEFSEHRQYSPGDDLRHFDWLALARTDRFFVKRYEQETNLRAHILLDVSGSMDYGTGGVTKLQYGCFLTALTAYLMARQQDQVGLVCFDRRIRAHLPPASSPAHLDRLFGLLEQIRPGKTTSFSATFHELAERMGKRGLVLVISDLFDEASEVMRALRHFRHRKHQVIVFHVLDPAELELPVSHVVTFVDRETGQRLQVDPKFVQEPYRRELDAFLVCLRRECNDSAIEYVQTTTRTPYDLLLRRYLASRRKVLQ